MRLPIPLNNVDVIMQRISINGHPPSPKKPWLITYTWDIIYIPPTIRHTSSLFYPEPKPGKTVVPNRSSHLVHLSLFIWSAPELSVHTQKLSRVQRKRTKQLWCQSVLRYLYFYSLPSLHISSHRLNHDEVIHPSRCGGSSRVPVAAFSLSPAQLGVRGQPSLVTWPHWKDKG